MITKDDCLTALRTNNLNSSMLMTLVHLFDTRPATPIPNHQGVHAIECQLVLRSGYMTAGALTVLENGVLHMAQPASRPNPTSPQHGQPVPILAHHYFTVADVQTIIVGETLETTTPASRIVIQ